MFLKLIKYILDKGPLVFRLDAIAFLWKRIDSDCIKLGPNARNSKVDKNLY